MKKRIVLISVLLVALLNINAQSTDGLIINLESVGMVGGGQHAPFWHTSNRQGLPSVEKSNGYAHIAAIGGLTRPGGFKLGYGLDVGLRAGLENNLILHQLYADVDYKWLGMSIGIKERWNDKNRYLSTGALTYSGNSKPIPELRVGIPDFVRISILGSWFSIKGHLGYGCLTDEEWRKNHNAEGYIDGILFHSKSVFIRFGDTERFPLQVTLGLEMNNIFGGTLYRNGTVKEMPSDAAAFWTVLFPFHHIEQQGNEDGDNLGSWHLNFDYYLNDWRIGAYYEHFYEDHSAMLGIEYKNNSEGKKDFIFYGFRHNWFDGMFGIEVNIPKNIRAVRGVVFEFLNTRGQSGPILYSGQGVSTTDVVEEVDGRDGMYNHGIYSSYTHHGYAIGNPVLISPAYNSSTSNRFRSNRVQMFHLGIDGGITKSIDYRMLATTTRHWGQYGAPLKEVERVTSVMLECSYKFGGEYGWRVSLSGAADFDSAVGSGAQVPLLGCNRGVMVTVSKTLKVR